MRGKTRAATGAAFIPLPHLKMSIVEDKMNARQGAVRRKVLANFYARFLEDGTSKMQPHKFVEPAIKATEQKLLEDFTADVISQIREEFGA